MLDELKILVGELYELYGATTQVVKLSQILDELIVEAQKVKVSFDSEKLVKWYNEYCGIECEDCPLDEYICDTLSLAAYVEHYKKVLENIKNNK